MSSLVIVETSDIGPIGRILELLEGFAWLLPWGEETRASTALLGFSPSEEESQEPYNPKILLIE